VGRGMEYSDEAKNKNSSIMAINYQYQDQKVTT